VIASALDDNGYQVTTTSNSDGRESIPLKIRINDIITMEDA